MLPPHGEDADEEGERGHNDLPGLCGAELSVAPEPVLGRIVNLDRIPNTEYVRVLRMNRIRILNSAIRSKLFE